MGRGLRIGHGPQVFPLSRSSNGRYLQQANGTPFLLTGDSPWMILSQLDDDGIREYLDAAQAAGINGAMTEMPGVAFTSQTPSYDNVDGEQPFASMTSQSNINWASDFVEAYWQRGDLFGAETYARGIAWLIQPAYMGFGGGSEGWNDALNNATTGALRTYGQRLGARFNRGNEIWIAGGDYDGNDGSYDKQKVIFEEIRALQPNALITGHSNPDEAAFPVWGGESWFNLNCLYCYADVGSVFPYQQAAQEYARDPALPLFFLEGRYENENGYTAAIGRMQMYAPFLAGALGGFLKGSAPLWHFGSPNGPSGSGTYQDGYTSAIVTALGRFRTLMTAYPWQLLEPKTDASLVSSSLSSGLSRIVPALASDATFAMIWVPSSQTVTVVTNALSGVAGNVRIRLYNPTNGQYTVVQASIAKSSGQAVATGGERIIVVDEAP